MAIKLIYSDLPLGAADDAEIITAKYEEFSKPEELPFGVSSGAVATLEPNAWGLSSEIKTKDSQPFAFWSNAISNNKGIFATPPEIKIEFSEQYTATGISFRFSPGLNEYCNNVYVEWWQNGAVKESGNFSPTSAVYVLEKTVEAFDKIVIKLLSTNLPFRRAKLEALITGAVREIDGKELISSQYINEIDLISNIVPINVLDAEFHSLSNADLIFQKKQPVEAFDNDNLIGVYYIETGERLGRNRYNFSCQDAIGILDKDTYPGGLWLKDILAVDLLTDIVGGSFELDISPEYAESKIRGYMPECTRREALQKVAFSLGAIIDTTGTKKIKVFPPTISGEGVEISPKETYIGGKVTTSDTVTEVVVHGYDIEDKRPTEPWHKYIEYDDEQYKYELTKATAVNPNVSSGTLPNKIEFTECYLISSENAQQRANEILSYYMRRNIYNASHIVRANKPGERASISLPWGGSQNSNILRMQVVTSGITVSNTDFLLD